MEILRLANALEGYLNDPKIGRVRRARVRAVLAAVKEGEFDSTSEESDRWAASKEGQEVMSELSPEARKKLFGA